MTGKTGYVWHLRRLMAEHGMFATTDLGPLLAMRGVCLSREQVYRLVTRTPERLSLTTLAALCDILGCEPGDLVEPVAPGGRGRLPGRDLGARLPGPVRPRRARILPGPGKDA
jgi:DNA-binding Xre family transcriptional regulator